MATRKPTPKRRTTQPAAKRQPPRRRAGGKGSAQRPAMPQFALSPNLQREIFAVVLICLGLLTLVFSTFGGDQGAIGSRWNATVMQAFGTGRVLVPVALGILGGLIIFQEHFSDSRLTGANVVGTVMVLLALLVLLEFPAFDSHRTQEVIPVGEGGGVVGNVVLSILVSAIGKAGAMLLSLTIGIIGIMLTFNLTIRQIMSSVIYYSGSVRGIGRRLLGAPVERYPEPPARPLDPRELMLAESRQAPAAARRRGAAAAPGNLMGAAPTPAQLQQELEELVLTPIAERPAQASLFNRGQLQAEMDRRPARRKEPVPPPLAPPVSINEAPTKKLPPRANAKNPAPPAGAAGNAPGAAEPLDESAEDETYQPAGVRAWPLPALAMLDTHADGQISDEEKREKARIIEETLASFKVEARVVEANTGPAVTQFALQPAIGVKISKITSLHSDLALALAAPSLRIEAPVPGRSVVGIEIPNSAISMVGMRDVMESDEYEANKRGKLKIPLGKDVSGTATIADMTKMPHLLVAGSTGSGKSICINSIIVSLLLKHTPNELKFIMVDPKMVELIVYNSIPHLLTPVVTELERVVSSLKWAVREMERRYKIFAKGGFRNLDSYMAAARKRPDLEPLPYIIVIIDELADLMMLAPDEVETLICRLAQMARATGIHLIIATQRPSVDVVTGLIKANFPSRIAFAVTSQIDSRVILDTPGAEQLLGRGDMLYLAADAAKPVRIQGTYVSDGEVEQVVRFWRAQHPEGTRPDSSQPGAPAANASPAAQASQAAASTSMGDVFLQADEQDELLPKAVELVKQHQRASASMLQRRLRIGYSKAAQLIDLLEQQGVVGPAEGGRSREVLAPNRDAKPGE